MLQVGGGYLRGLGGMFSMLSQQGKKKKKTEKVCLFLVYRVPPALSTRLRFQFHPQPYFLFIISLQSHQPSCCSSELPHLLSLATPLIICSTYVLAWLMPSLLGSLLNAITSKKSPLITLLSCSLSPWHALFSHSTYHHLIY